MELTIANHCDSSHNVVELEKDMIEFKKIFQFSKSSTKDAMNMSKAKPVWSTERPNLKEKRSAPFKDTIRRHPTLKEL